MTSNDQPPFTIAELGARFGSQMAATIAELITLEKIVEQQRKQIQDLSNRENSLIDSIQDLEMELDQWKADFIKLKTELAELKMSLLPNLSEKEAALAKEGQGDH